MVGQEHGPLSTSPVMPSERTHCGTWYKRLEVGTFRMPAAGPDAASVELKASELAMLLAGIDLGSIRCRKRFQRPA